MISIGSLRRLSDLSTWEAAELSWRHPAVGSSWLGPSAGMDVPKKIELHTAEHNLEQSAVSVY